MTAEKMTEAQARGMAALDRALTIDGVRADGVWVIGQYVQTDDAYTWRPDGPEGRAIDMPDAIRLLVGGRVVKIGCPDRGLLEGLTRGLAKLDPIAVPVFARGPFNPDGDRGRVTFKVRGASGDSDE